MVAVVVKVSRCVAALFTAAGGGKLLLVCGNGG